MDVQNRVASVEGRLPGEVVSTGITVDKSNYNFVFGAGFFTRDGRYSDEYISNYLDVYVKDALKRVPGVGDVDDLQRAQVRHARVARSGAAGGPRPDRSRRSERA